MVDKSEKAVVLTKVITILSEHKVFFIIISLPLIALGGQYLVDWKHKVDQAITKFDEVAGKIPYTLRDSKGEQDLQGKDDAQGTQDSPGSLGKDAKLALVPGEIQNLREKLTVIERRLDNIEKLNLQDMSPLVDVIPLNKLESSKGRTDSLIQNAKPCRLIIRPEVIKVIPGDVLCSEDKTNRVEIDKITRMRMHYTINGHNYECEVENDCAFIMTGYKFIFRLDKNSHIDDRETSLFFKN